MAERVQRDVFRAERHALEIEMLERTGDMGDREALRLEAIALKEWLSRSRG